MHQEIPNPSDFFSLNDCRFAQPYKQYMCIMTETSTIDEQWAVR